MRHNLSRILVTLLLFTGSASFAQVVLSLDNKVRADMPASTLSGNYWTMQLEYSVSSTTGSASGVKITVDLPDYVYQANGLSGTIHAPLSNFVFDNTEGTKKLTIAFVDPLPSGSTGVLEYRLRTLNGYTPDGTVIETCAVLKDDKGNSSASSCDQMPIIANNKFCGHKVLKSGGALGYPVTYRVFLTASKTYPTSGSVGSLNASNISITDYYPSGATLVSARLLNSNDVEIPTTLTYGTNSVTATVPDYNYNPANNGIIGVSYLEVTVIYNEPEFGLTTPITNRASITYTPLGKSTVTIDETTGSNGSFCTNDLIETHTLQSSLVSGNLEKSTTTDIIATGRDYSYKINFTNTGTTPLENIVITENVPDELMFISSRLDAKGTEIDSVHYQTDIDPTWRNLASGSAPSSVVLGGGKITKIRLKLPSPYGAGQSFSGTNILTFRTNSGITDSTVVENCLSWTSSTPGLVTDDVCNTNVTIIPVIETGRITYRASQTPRCVSYYVGRIIKFTGDVTSSIGYQDTENPVLGFFLPDAFQYQTGSEIFTAGSSAITDTPTLTILPGYMERSGISYSLYRFTFPTGTKVPAGATIKISVDVKLTSQIATGVAYPSYFFADGSNVTIYDRGHSTAVIPDTNDWDLDGNTLEEIKLNTTETSCPVLIVASASMESIKWVKGLLDEDYSRYPAFGQTVPGGNADYKLIVKNTGNIPMKDIKIIDILPYVGDRGVIDPQARLTEWRPNLAAPISAPAGTTISYSLEKNPCRDELRQPGDSSPFPSGCQPAAWSTTPPADITRVQSVMIDFGSTVLGVGDSLTFAWPMRAPVTAPTEGEIAWNSFGFVATRTDNNQPLLAAEPIKVGIKVITGLPAYYGDRVWYDDNRNGLQDAGEAGVDGVTVHLYSPAVAGVQNPAVDSLVNFTITGNGGLYKFSNLTPGDYYAVFFLPSGFSISPDNQGTNDAIDSDGVPGTLDGQTVTIVPITTLEDEEEDYTWDQGIYCLLTPAVSPIQVLALNESVTLTASGGTTYLWSGPNGFTATTASITINAVTPADTGTYTVTIMDGECRASLSTGIEIEDCPIIVAPVVESDEICVGTSFLLTGMCTSPANIRWYSDEALTSPITNMTVNPQITTDYYAVCVNETCTSATSVLVVTVNPQAAAPTGVTATPSEIYIGESSVLTATCAAGLTPSWFTDEALTTHLASTTVSPVASTTYYVICGEDKDCAEVAEITVTVTDEPLVFDLALRKTMAPGSKTIYKVGDVVTFNITVFNQGTVAATSVDLVDYIPAGLTLQDANWTPDGDKARWNGAITNLAPETQRTVTISFVVNSNAAGIVINTAEISGAGNEEGLEDKDSTPDDDKGNDGPVKNDEIDEDGTDGRDEDDHDIEPIIVCPDAKCLNVKTVRNK